MSTLKIVIASNRPGRLGAPIGQWLADRARRAGSFDRVEILDLADIDLPSTVVGCREGTTEGLLRNPNLEAVRVDGGAPIVPDPVPAGGPGSQVAPEPMIRPAPHRSR